MSKLCTYGFMSLRTLYGHNNDLIDLYAVFVS